jgi:hypothetical protein
VEYLIAAKMHAFELRVLMFEHLRNESKEKEKNTKGYVQCTVYLHIKNTQELGSTTHTCKSSYAGGRNQKDRSLKPA